MNDQRVLKILQALEELTRTAGEQETTKIIPNCEVIDSNPSGMTGYIIVKNELGYYTPAVKSPDLSYTDGDLVNLLIIKGTEPIAFQHGSGSGSGGYPSGPSIATQVEVDAGVNDTKYITPLKLANVPIDHVSVSKLTAPDGSPDPALSVDNAGDTTAAGNILVASGKDIYIAGDEAGVKQRSVNLNHTNITDHFSAFSGWTWAMYPGFGTPANIDVSTIPDHAQIYHNTNTKGFAYQTFPFSAATSIFCRLIPGTQGYYGLRFDDGTNSNYCMITTQFVTSKALIYQEYCIAGVVTGPTALVSDLPHSYLHIQLRRTSTAALWFYTTNTHVPQFLATQNMSWTPTSWGLYVQNTNPSTNFAHSLTIDWITKE